MFIGHVWNDGLIQIDFQVIYSLLIL